MTSIPYSMEVDADGVEVTTTAMLFSSFGFAFFVEVGTFDNEDSAWFALCEIVDQIGYDSGDLVRIDDVREFPVLHVDTPHMEARRVAEPYREEE